MNAANRLVQDLRVWYEMLHEAGDHYRAVENPPVPPAH